MSSFNSESFVRSVDRNSPGRIRTPEEQAQIDAWIEAKKVKKEPKPAMARGYGKL